MSQVNIVLYCFNKNNDDLKQWVNEIITNTLDQEKIIISSEIINLNLYSIKKSSLIIKKYLDADTEKPFVFLNILN